MRLSDIATQAGRCWGHVALRPFHRLYDRRCASFAVSVRGAHHLRVALEGGPCLIVANHVLLRPEDTLPALLIHARIPPGRLTQALVTRNHRLLLFHAPPDSFLLRRVVRNETGNTLRVVSLSNLGKWSARKAIRWLQEQVSHPFGNGLREGLGYLPLEYTSRSRRTFLSAVEEAVRSGHPVLIFPGRVVWDRPWHPRDSLLEGGISPGAAHLAIRYGLTVLPVYLSGGDSWRAGQIAGITCGPAFRCDGMTKAEASREIVDRIRALGAQTADPGTDQDHAASSCG